jgi:WXG100 family type VII secretion target
MAPTDNMVVDFAAMHQAAADIQAAINKLTSDLEQLDADAKPLVSTWTGDAQQAYFQRQATWTTAANDLSQMLRNIQKALVDSTSDYQSTETTNTNLFA